MSEATAGAAERRDFLASAAYWTTVGALGMATLGVSRMPRPGVLPGPAATIKIGAPGDYPLGPEPMRVPGQNLYVVHTPEGFGVLAAICTHLGCIVAPIAEGFECPCHGSKFGPEGGVVRGPAPSALKWYEVSLAPDGQLVVDTSKTVPLGTRFQFS